MTDATHVPPAVSNVPVEVFADHIVLRPPNKLKERVTRRVDPKSNHEPDPIARAEHALDLLSHEFDSWMNREADALEAARDAVARERTTAGVAKLYRAAHDIRGQAATFGFPLVGEIADGLCGLIERTGDRPPQDVVDRHVEAIRAMVREGVRERDHPMGVALSIRLSELRDAIAPRIDGE